MHRPDEDGTKDHPQQRGQPAPEHRDRGTDDGSRAGNAGEVMAEDHLLARRHVIDIVAELMAWHSGGFIQLEHLAS